MYQGLALFGLNRQDKNGCAAPAESRASKAVREKFSVKGAGAELKGQVCGPHDHLTLHPSRKVTRITPLRGGVGLEEGWLPGSVMVVIKMAGERTFGRERGKR